EDGIRDKLVTGDQTCALPIWLAGWYHDGAEILQVCLAKAHSAANDARRIAVGTMGAAGQLIQDRGVHIGCALNGDVTWGDLQSADVGGSQERSLLGGGSVKINRVGRQLVSGLFPPLLGDGLELELR